MSTQSEEKDETLAELNRQLDEEKRRKEIDDAVEERLAERKRTEVKPAVFADKKDKKREIRIPKDKTHECIFCGEENIEKADNNTIYKVGGRLFSFVFHCKNCGKRQGAPKS